MAPVGRILGSLAEIALSAEHLQVALSEREMGMRRPRLDVVDLDRVVRAALVAAELTPSVVLLEHAVAQIQPIPAFQKIDALADHASSSPPASNKPPLASLSASWSRSRCYASLSSV